MNAKKLKVLFILVLVILILIIVFARFRAGEKIGDEISKNTPISTTEINTAAPVDFSTMDKSQRIIEDYTNPTDEDYYAVYSQYGFNNCYFTEEGLWVKGDEYQMTEKRLITNIWPENMKILEKVQKPDFGDLDIIEVGQSYVVFYFLNVEQKEANSYVKAIKKEYKKTYNDYESTTLYSAYNDDDQKIVVKYQKSTGEFSVKYNF